jgi:hypothetical protein
MAASRFVKVTGEEISNFIENAVPQSTKEAKKFGLKLFRARKLRCRILLNFISRKHRFFLKLPYNCLDICLCLYFLQQIGFNNSQNSEMSLKT